MKYKYDYQRGHCHYFADVIINKIRKLVPKDIPVNYYLILGERLNEDGLVDEDVLIHAYIKIKDYYLDSEGFHTLNDINDREQEWIDREEEISQDPDSFNTWQEEVTEIPEYFFNIFCEVKKVKKDIKEFLKQPKVKEFITKLHKRSNM